MPLTFLPALPFLLLLFLYPLKLLFSAAASTAGNFPEEWASSGLALRGALQDVGHAARWKHRHEFKSFDAFRCLIQIW